MKKIKILAAITSIATVISPTMVLTSCHDDINKNDPIIDPSLSGKVTQTIVRKEDGSVTCNLVTTNNKQKITDVSVKIGNTTLVQSTDYSVGNTNAGSTMSINIFKATLKKYKGDIVITPSVVDKTFSGITYTLPKISYYLEEKITTDDLKIFKSYEGTTGEQISWDDANLKISHGGEDITTEFKQNGYTFGTVKTEEFVVTYNTFTLTVSIKVTKQTFTITCSVNGSCLSLSEPTIVAEKDSTWGQVTKPTISANTDVDLDALTTTWCYEDGEPIGENDPITSSFKAILTYDFKNAGTAIKNAFSCQLLQEKTTAFKCRCYVYGTTSTVTPIDSNYDNIYTFECNLANVTGSFDYFWVGMKKTTESSTETRVVQLYPENIVGIYLVDNETNDTTPISYDFISGNKYIQYKNTYSTSDKTLRVVYRPLIGAENIKLYPGFEAD